MARVDVDTDLFDREETVLLCAILNNDDAWCYLVKLWAWALSRGTDADNAAGILRLSRRRLCETVGFRGDPDVFFEAMVESRWLVDVADNNGVVSYRMRGFQDRYSRYYREKARLAKRYAEKSASVTQGETASVTQLETKAVTQASLVLPSPSPSPIKEEIKAVHAEHKRYNPKVHALNPKAGDYKVIGKALKKWPVEDLIAAIRGCNEDEWHKSKRKNELEYIFRDAKIEKFIALGMTPPKEDDEIILNFATFPEDEPTNDHDSLCGDGPVDEEVQYPAGDAGQEASGEGVEGLHDDPDAPF